MAKTSESQMRITEQLNLDLGDVKLQLLLVSQALGAMHDYLQKLGARLERSGALGPEEGKLLATYKRAIAELQKKGLSLELPQDPSAKPVEVVCPTCQAKLKGKPGQRIGRCDWCGHEF